MIGLTISHYPIVEMLGGGGVGNHPDVRSVQGTNISDRFRLVNGGKNEKTLCSEWMENSRSLTDSRYCLPASMSQWQIYLSNFCSNEIRSSCAHGMEFLEQFRQHRRFCDRSAAGQSYGRERHEGCRLSVCRGRRGLVAGRA